MFIFKCCPCLLKRRRRTRSISSVSQPVLSPEEPAIPHQQTAVAPIAFQLGESSEESHLTSSIDELTQGQIKVLTYNVNLVEVPEIPVRFASIEPTSAKHLAKTLSSGSVDAVRDKLKQMVEDV
jgi:hypothetical protein